MLGFLNSKTLTLMEKTLDFRTKRHDLLVSNIANKDTPGYKAEDLVFEKSLGKALTAEQPGPLQTSRREHLDGRDAEPLALVQPERIQSAAPFADFNGNTVDLDKENAKLAENQLMYNAAIKMMTHQFKQLKTVLSEGR